MIDVMWEEGSTRGHAHTLTHIYIYTHIHASLAKELDNTVVVHGFCCPYFSIVSLGDTLIKHRKQYYKVFGFVSKAKSSPLGPLRGRKMLPTRLGNLPSSGSPMVSSVMQMNYSSNLCFHVYDVPITLQST